MKVVHVFKTYYPDTYGGMEETIRQLCLQTSQRGVSNTVVILSNKITEPETLERPECRLVRFPVTFDVASTPCSFSLFRTFRDLTRDADLIHYHFPWPIADLMHVFCRIQTPYIITYQSDIVKQKILKRLYSPLKHRFLAGARLISVATPQYMESSKVLSRHRELCRLMPLGLDEAHYPAIDEKRLQHWKDRLGSGFFLFVGVLRYYKGLEYLIRALPGTNFRIVIVGDGPMKDALSAEARKLDVQNQIIFTGYLSNGDKVCLYPLCAAFVFPSHLRSEAYGISLLEASIFRRCLISCEINTGTSHINKHGETGFVVEPANPDALRVVMGKIASSPEMARTMGDAARQRFEKYFSADQMGKICLSLYREALDQSK